jgi:hypothetical protein
VSAQGDLKLSDHLLIFGVQADPKPQITFFHFHSEGALFLSCPHRPVFPHFFEVQGWMAWIGFEQLEIFVRHILND